MPDQETEGKAHEMVARLTCGLPVSPAVLFATRGVLVAILVSLAEHGVGLETVTLGHLAVASQLSPPAAVALLHRTTFGPAYMSGDLAKAVVQAGLGRAVTLIAALTDRYTPRTLTSNLWYDRGVGAHAPATA